jgi:hypothetical protein
MADISRQTAARQAITRTVVSSIHTHNDALTQKLEALLFPKGVPPDLTLGLVCGALSQLLQRDIADVVHSDQEVARELGEDRGARDHRDTKATALRKVLFKIRSAVDSLGGDQAVTKSGLGGRIPTQADALLPFASNVATQIVTLTFEDNDDEFVTLNVKVASERITAATRLEQSLTGVQKIHVIEIAIERVESLSIARVRTMLSEPTRTCCSRASSSRRGRQRGHRRDGIHGLGLRRLGVGDGLCLGRAPIRELGPQHPL